MKILQAIKSMHPAMNKPTCPDISEQNSVLFGITTHEAKERIQRVVTSHVVKTKANASDTLRAICSSVDNGEQLTSASTLNPGDIIVIAPKEFREGFEIISPHGMIVHINAVDPFNCDIYEMARDNRNEHTIKVCNPLPTQYANLKMNYVISPQVSEERVNRYLARNIAAGYGFRMKLNSYEVYMGFKQACENAEAARKLLSKYADTHPGAYYGISRCNNFVYDVVKLALEMRNNENNN